MVLYVSTILVCMVIIAVVNVFLVSPTFGFSPLYVIFAVILSTVGTIVIDGIFATLIRRAMPEKWFDVDKTYYKASKREAQFYEKIGIKKWKDKVVELGGFTNFHKNKLGDTNDIEYVRRFIIESNYGVLIHLVCIIAGFGVIFIYPLKFWLCFGFPVGVVNAVLNALTLFILRYNLPKLHALYKFNQRKRIKTAKAQNTE